MNFDIIVATDDNGVIAVNGKIPWNCPEDLQFFRKQTISKAVIMGRKTWESLPKKLEGRINIVISSGRIDGPDQVFRTLNDALAWCCENKEQAMVIGGAQLYQEALRSPFLVHILHNKIKSVPYFSESNSILKFIVPEKARLLEYRRGENVDYFKYIIHDTYNREEEDYLKLLREIITYGDKRNTRNGITFSLFAKTLSFDLSIFPLLTTKKMFLRGIFEELIWFLQGKTNSKLLEEKKVNIWKGNTSKSFLDSLNLSYEEGDIGPMYGFQLRHFGEAYDGCDKSYEGFDQIEYCIQLLRTDKFSRRILMTTFCPSMASQGVLYPCHGICTQFYVRCVDGVNYLDCSMTQRSADAFLGLPFNIASYALLVYLLCEVLENFKPGKLTMLLNDVHIYESHIEAVKEQLNRNPIPFPKLDFVNHHDDIRDYCFGDLELTNYYHYPAIKAEMIV